MKSTRVFDIFSACTAAITSGTLIRQISRTDKEFHFQNWFEERLSAADVLFDKGGRNSFPDFALVEFTEGYEIKGLAWPGREASYDSNSRAPTGFHNGRDIFYVFGRYPPTNAGETEYPVIDLVICHGDFLNADHDYLHKNRNVKGFGSYGDIMIRDRKMYVARTPFAIVSGLTGSRTLLVPATWSVPEGFLNVGSLARIEADRLVVGYEFDLTHNTIAPKLIQNPTAGAVHRFEAYRLGNDPGGIVALAPGEPTSG
jgi:hypothetical protein